MSDFKEKIEQDIVRAKKKPKIFFIAEKLFLFTALILLFTAGVFGSALFFLRLRFVRPFLFLSLGRAGIRPFFLGFPWLFLALVFSTLFILEGLGVKKGPFFKKPLVFSLILLISLFLVFGFFFSFCQSFNKAGLRSLHQRPSRVQVMTGKISEVQKDFFMLKRDDNGFAKILLPLRAGLPNEAELEQDQQVQVLFDRGVKGRPLRVRKMK